MNLLTIRGSSKTYIKMTPELIVSIHVRVYSSVFAGCIHMLNLNVFQMGGYKTVKKAGRL